MLKLSSILFFIFILTFSGTEIPKNEDGKGFVSDFNILVTSLKELQPVLYKNITKVEFDKQVKIVSERLLTTTTRNTAIYIIQEFFYKLGNSHAGNVSVYGDLGVTKALPMSFYVVNSELYIKNYPADTTYNGTKIISIGNTKAEMLIDSLKIFFLRACLNLC